MNLKSLVVVAALVVSTSAFAAEATFERTLSVNGVANLSAQTGSGTIRIHAGDDRSIHIVGHVRSSNGWSVNGHGTDADKVKQIAANPPIAQAGNDVTIGERHSSDLYRNISIDYDMSVPRGTRLTLGSGSGDIEVQAVGSNLKASTGSGSIRASGVQGPANLDSGSGDIEFEQTAPGDVRVQTGSGSIRLHDLAGGLRAGTGSGDIEASGKITADSKLETGSGSIRLNLGPQARFNLDASTGSGTIRTAQAIAMQGEINKHHVTGPVNGGGPTLRASTGSGDIEIR